MRKPAAVHLRAIHAPRNGRPAHRARVAAAATRAWTRFFSGWGFFRGLRRAIGEVVAMAFVLALAIVLAHAMLIVMFPI